MDTTDPDKRKMLENMESKSNACLKLIKSSSSLTEPLMTQVVTECRDPLADWLDKKVNMDMKTKVFFGQ